MARSRRSLLCTLGPNSLDEPVIARLEALGVGLFRINLSHTPLERVAELLRYLQARTGVPICLDTEGAQVRTGRLRDGRIALREHSIVQVSADPVDGDETGFSLYPAEVVDALEIGDLLSIDFDAVLAQVVATRPGWADLRVLSAGRMGSNQGVALSRPIDLPPLTEKDRKALEIGASMGIRNIALSFASRPEDVDEIRDAFGRPARVISKIESVQGLNNLDGIIARTDAILIDRGDLSREVPIQRIPLVQKHVIKRCNSAGMPVFVATNLLESMVAATSPTRAEVNDVYNTLMDGADGLVLAAETAIGKYPVRCANMIVNLMREFETDQSLEDGAYPEDPSSTLVEPHGGRLVHREASPSELVDLHKHRTLAVDGRDLMDSEQIALGTYSPVRGFMTRAELESVLRDFRLPDGPVWTMPLILQIPEREATRLAVGERVVLTDGRGTPRAFLDVTEVYQVDLDAVARAWFGTASPTHPGVAAFSAAGDWLAAGEVTLIERRPSPHRHHEFTPHQTRQIFTHKGWSRVVGFHSRNVAHRAHEFIQIEALKRTHADGLYINPVIGSKKPGDFLPEPILDSYQLLLEREIYPTGKTLLGSFSTYSRYCGPREAVFTALCRKNMGCSHFIVGRDHTGVGDYYPADANRAMFETLGDLGVEPVFFETIAYNPRRERYEPADGDGPYEAISGSRMRQAILSNEPLPDWFMRESVQALLREAIAAGRPVFSE